MIGMFRLACEQAGKLVRRLCSDRSPGTLELSLVFFCVLEYFYCLQILLCYLNFFMQGTNLKSDRQGDFFFLLHVSYNSSHNMRVWKRFQMSLLLSLAIIYRGFWERFEMSLFLESAVEVALQFLHGLHNFLVLLFSWTFCSHPLWFSLRKICYVMWSIIISTDNNNKVKMHYAGIILGIMLQSRHRA